MVVVAIAFIAHRSEVTTLIWFLYRNLYVCNSDYFETNFIDFLCNVGTVNSNKNLLFGNPPARTGYEPTFTDNITYATQQLAANASRICGSNKACLFDIAVTDSVDIGLQTKLIDDNNTKQKAELG